jgi:hypothetical protein
MIAGLDRRAQKVAGMGRRAEMTPDRGGVSEETRAHHTQGGRKVVPTAVLSPDLERRIDRTWVSGAAHC